MFISTLLTASIMGQVGRVQLTDNHGPYIAAGAPFMLQHTLEKPGWTVHLLDHDGQGLCAPVPLMPGSKVDIRTHMPVVNTLDHAAFLQLVNPEGVGINTALVVEPALSRRTPVTAQVETDGRGTWTRIIGWQDEGAIDNDELPDGAGRIDGAALSAPVPRDEAVIRSGHWVYPERDVRMATDHGELWIDMREDAAPGTCRNFRALAGMGFYNDTRFHRIINEGRNGRPFVIQGGDPTGTGEGGPGWWTPIEPSHLPHAYGVVSMARADDPDSAGSQWFIALDRQETARLDGQYCAFGWAT